MDFSKVNDPFDPEFHKSLSKKKALVYHGTSTKHFWSIIQNGFVYQKDTRHDDNSSEGVFFSFDYDAAGIYAAGASKKFGGEMLFIVAEVPLSMLERDPDDAEGWDKGKNYQSMARQSVPARYITGVHYPATNRKETPIRKFIQMVNAGKVPDIDPQPEFRGRFAKATPDDIEHALVNYLLELIGYTSFSHHQTESSHEFTQKVIQGIQDVPRNVWLSWNGKSWVQWMEKLLGEKNEEESYYNEYPEYRVPFIRVMNKYSDSEGFNKFRLGKKWNLVII